MITTVINQLLVGAAADTQNTFLVSTRIGINLVSGRSVWKQYGIASQPSKILTTTVINQLLVGAAEDTQNTFLVSTHIAKPPEPILWALGTQGAPVPQYMQVKAGQFSARFSNSAAVRQILLVLRTCRRPLTDPLAAGKLRSH